MGSFATRISGAQKFTSAIGDHIVLAATSRATFFTAVAYNGTGGNAWLQIFDAAAEPSLGANPTLPPLLITAGDTRFYDFYDYGRSFATGIVVAMSSTAATYTAAADSNFIDVGTR